MYISYNWLQDFVKLPSKTNYNEVAQKLTAHTVEIESVNNQADNYKNIIVGKVLEVKKHPNADRLKVVVVDIKEKKLKIVCGASNIDVGQLVPVALDGAVLPGGLEIKTSKIRGEVSEGMVCAEDELNLGTDHDGIMVLDEKAKTGGTFASYLKTNDVIFEVDNKSLSNRPDLLNHYGLARELSVIFSAPLKPYKEVIGKSIISSEDKKGEISVSIEEKKKCPRYMAIKIDNIKVGSSPKWLKERLVAINQRPINNIVDLANYVMFDCGQPLHTFDGSKVKKIIVKNAQANEIVETLDKKERNLTVDDLIISDGKKPIAIAGVIGSFDSQITNNSHNLILEAANFNAANIRKTAQRLGIRSEASVRYEKSLDPNLTEDALKRYVSLLLEICPKAVIKNVVSDVYSEKQENKKVNLNFSWLFKKIGQEIPKKDVLGSLSRLGFVVEEKGKEMEITIPTWRATKDVDGKEDIVEEVLRIYGYDNVQSFLPEETLTLPRENKERELERKIKNIFYLRFNLMEVHNYSFVGEEQLKKLNIDFFHYLKIANPLSELNSMLRQSLAPGLFHNVKTNQTKSDDLGFFEIGNTFFNAQGGYDRGDSTNTRLPYQEKRIGVVLASKNNPFLKLKDIASNFVKEIFGENSDVNFSKFENNPGWSDKKATAIISISGEELGWLGSVNQEVNKNLNIKLETALLELNFNKINKLLSQQSPFRLKETPKYPSVIRDISFVVLDKILYNDIKEVISNFHPLIKEIELFDVYQGNKLSEGEKSLAFRITYQSLKKTLRSGEVDEVQNSLLKKMDEKFNAKLRNF